jgi:uncharacterized membrane protein YkoI
MRKLATLLLAGLLGAGFGVRALANENENENESGHEHKSVTMAELPPAVQSTFKQEAKGGKIEELRKETRKDGSVIYEGEIVKNGKGTDIEVNSAGKVVERGKTHDESSEHEKR